jgi:hypothetical protein
VTATGVVSLSSKAAGWQAVDLWHGTALESLGSSECIFGKPA